MSENQTPHNQQPGSDKDDLLSELRELGQQLEASFRTAIECERAKQLQKDIAGGVRELTEQIKTAVKTVQSDPRFQQAEERGRQVVSQARDSKVVQDIQETVISGLAQLSEQLRKVVEGVQQDAASQAGQNPTSEKPNAATGETTRLDD